MIDDGAGVFRALADPTRRQILQDLRAGELPAGGIASRFTISGPSISRHLFRADHRQEPAHAVGETGSR